MSILIELKDFLATLTKHFPYSSADKITLRKVSDGGIYEAKAWEVGALVQPSSVPVPITGGAIDIAGTAEANDGSTIQVTGTDDVTSIPVKEGTRRKLVFVDGAPLVHSSTLLLPGGADFKALAGDAVWVTGLPDDVTEVESFRFTGAQKADRVEDLESTNTITTNIDNWDAVAVHGFIESTFLINKPTGNPRDLQDYEVDIEYESGFGFPDVPITFGGSGDFLGAGLSLTGLVARSGFTTKIKMQYHLSLDTWYVWCFSNDNHYDWEAPLSAGVDEAKAYTDAQLAAAALNLGKRPRVRAATTGNITISTALNNGDTLDGVTLATGDLVLVKDQSTGSQNGIYVVGASPSRAPEFDSYDEYPGSAVFVQEGTVNADTPWLCTSNIGGTLGSTAIVFVSTNIIYVSDAAYNATSWNGVTDKAPSKNAVRDEMELRERLASKDAADGYAGLNSDGRILIGSLPRLPFIDISADFTIDGDNWRDYMHQTLRVTTGCNITVADTAADGFTCSGVVEDIAVVTEILASSLTIVNRQDHTKIARGPTYAGAFTLIKNGPFLYLAGDTEA